LFSEEFDSDGYNRGAEDDSMDVNEEISEDDDSFEGG
jgi:hypothetical protein